MPDATSVCSVEGCNGTYSTPTRLRPNTPGVGTMGICQIHARRFRNSGDVHKIRCSCNCGQLVDLYGNNETVKSYLPGHREAETKARKQARAQAVLELYEWSAEPPEITRSEATDLNYLLAQTGRRRCCTCKAIKPIEEFARRISPDKRKPNGRISTCTPCAKEQVAQWRANNTNKHTHTCVNCGTEFTRSEYVAKCCSSKCASEWGALGAGRHHQRVADGTHRNCARSDCDAVFLRTDTGVHNGKWCSEACYQINIKRSQSKGPLRQAVESWDYPGMVTALLNKVTIEGPHRCWVYPTTDQSGYSTVHWTNSNLYRLVLEVKHGAPLGSQVAHHACGTRACVRPEHLQPVTHAQNIAEMLQRRSYKDFIAECLDAIAGYNPDDPLLQRIPLM